MTYVEDKDFEREEVGPGGKPDDAIGGAEEEERQPDEGEVEETGEESFPASDPPSF
ncbi:MAG: hypothetical protein M3516_04625 [Actinomycetota bacterium]|nr:hypothetical protein [Actinomycetota bacterium]